MESGCYGTGSGTATTCDPFLRGRINSALRQDEFCATPKGFGMTGEGSLSTKVQGLAAVQIA
jgi:hypothetical protein